MHGGSDKIATPSRMMCIRELIRKND